jgi:hypothetical protein
MAELVRYQTPIFRVSFPAMFKAESYDGGEPKFGLSAIWTPARFSDKEKALWAKIMKGLDDEALAKFKKKWNDLPANVKCGLRDGAEKPDLEGYGDGTMFASLTTKMRPGLVDRNKLPIIREDEKERYQSEGKEFSEEEFYSYDNKGKGVALGLMNVQKVRDGDRLDSRSDAASDFDDDFLEDGDTDGFLDD